MSLRSASVTFNGNADARALVFKTGAVETILDLGTNGERKRPEMDEDFDLLDIEFFNANLALTHLSLASIHAAEGRIDAAIEEYTQVLEFDPNLYLCYLNRGKLYHRKGEREKAKADFTRAIALEPRSAITYIYRGDLFYDMGDYSSAREDYRKALQLNPDSREALFRLKRMKRAR